MSSHVFFSTKSVKIDADAFEIAHSSLAKA